MIIQVVMVSSVQNNRYMEQQWNSQYKLFAQSTFVINYILSCRDMVWPVLGRGDNLQLFISALLKYEGWLYNIIDDKNFEINSLDPLYRGSENSTYPHGDL